MPDALATTIEGAERTPTLGEEIANSVSHGVGWLLAVAAAPFLLLATAREGGTTAIVGAAVFAGAMLLVYLVSTLYHAVPRNRAKRILQTLDHCAIFLLIAGTYTPFTLGILRGAWGWTLFGLVWGICIAGILFKLVMGGERWHGLAVVMYLTAGWLAVIAQPVWSLLPPSGVAWIVAGGVAYTVGVPFCMATRLRYGHLVWHLFTMGGTACHFVAVARYAA